MAIPRRYRGYLNPKSALEPSPTDNPDAGKPLMNWLQKLPGHQRAPAGLEWALWRKLPHILAAGTALTLANGSERLALTVNGAFSFGETLADGTEYAVVVLTQPAIGSCSVRNGSGRFFAATFTDIVVSCN